MRRKSESGQTVRAFCRDNGIKEDRYYYWQRRLRTAVGAELCMHSPGAASVRPDTGESPVFAQVPVAAGHTYPDVVRMEAGGITIEINPGADMCLAESILRLLLGRC